MRSALLLLTLAIGTAPPAFAQTVRPALLPGWVGVDGILVTTTLGVRPVVIVRTVAPGSPAAQAGLAPGDTVIALDGTAPSVAKFQALRTQLRAGDRLELTVRRGQVARTVSVLATPRPGDFELPVVVRFEAGLRALSEPMVAPSGTPGWIFGDPSLPPSDVGATPVGWTTPYLVGQDRVAGARITALNPGLSEYFGTDRGLLVIEVTPGTPAAAARLLAGDVLIRVGDVEVDEMRSLRQAVATAPTDRPLRVLLVRRGRQLELELLR